MSIRDSQKWYGRLIRWIEREREIRLKPGHDLYLLEGDWAEMGGKVYYGPCVIRNIKGKVTTHAHWDEGCS
jgi:hypothetical protein